MTHVAFSEHAWRNHDVAVAVAVAAGGTAAGAGATCTPTNYSGPGDYEPLQIPF